MDQITDLLNDYLTAAQRAVDRAEEARKLWAVGDARGAGEVIAAPLASVDGRREELLSELWDVGVTPG